jgi:nanoRNase/pAp phosphatase (c-di-AMP/oligoRNAs hydrolase)
LQESTTAVNDGLWHNVVVVKATGVSTKFYIDGSYKSDGGSNNTGNLTNSYQFYIGGGNAYAGVFSGLIDDVRVYNRALSAAEIAAIYNGGK